jgi:hypothetical protein|nr:MAG TPA: hypothetical protein [Caudoviricetes sp.]
MNDKSKELWKFLLIKYTNPSFVKEIKEVESVQETYNRNYLIKIILENNKKDFVELSREIVVDFLKSQKSTYYELIIDVYCNFKEVINNYELFVREMENVKYLIEKESKFLKEQIQEIRKDFEQLL